LARLDLDVAILAGITSDRQSTTVVAR